MDGYKRTSKQRLKAAAAAAGIFFLTFSTFTGCSRAGGREEGIRPADLTQKEEDILNLYGGEENSRIFDFSVPENMKSASVRLKILNPDGQWMDHGRAVISNGEKSGRILVTTTDGWQTVKMVLQDATGMSSASFQSGDEDSAGKMTASSWLDEGRSVEDGEEIPLLIHVETEGDSVASGGISDFEDTASLREYDRVFAVTITFSEP